MKFRSVTFGRHTAFVFFAVFSTALALCSQAGALDPPVGRQQALGAPSEPDSDDSASAKELNERYSKVYLKIAQLNLQKAVEANHRVANTIPAAEVERLQQIVRLAEAQLDAKEGPEDKSLTLESDASEVKLAEESLQKAVVANNRAPGSISQIELDRLRLMAELSRLQLAKDKAANSEKAGSTGLQKRVEQLEDEVHELREQLSELKQLVGEKSGQSRGRESRP